MSGECAREVLVVLATKYHIDTATEGWEESVRCALLRELRRERRTHRFQRRAGQQRKGWTKLPAATVEKIQRLYAAWGRSGKKTRAKTIEALREEFKRTDPKTGNRTKLSAATFRTYVADIPWEGPQ